MKQFFRVFAVFLFLSILMTAILILLDMKRQIQIVFIFPQASYLRYSPAKSFLVRSVSDVFENKQARTFISTQYPTVNEPYQVAFSNQVSTKNPKIVFFFEDARNLFLAQESILSKPTVLFAGTIQSKKDFDRFPQLYPLLSTKESFYDAIHLFFDEDENSEIYILSDSMFIENAREIRTDLQSEGKEISIIEIKSSEQPIPFPFSRTEGDSLPFLFFYCSAEYVLPLLQEWSGFPRDRVLLSPWSMPYEDLLVDVQRLQDVRAISPVPLKEPIGVSPITIALQKNFFELVQKLRNFDDSERLISEILQTYRDSAEEETWYLVKYDKNGFVTEKKNSSTSGTWEEVP